MPWQVTNMKEVLGRGAGPAWREGFGQVEKQPQCGQMKQEQGYSPAVLPKLCWAVGGGDAKAARC